MQDNDTLLLIMQAGSMGTSLTLCLLLVLSRFQKPDTTKIYEQIRLLLIFAMLLLFIHYALQMGYGFRAQGDDVGALINILFYSPVIYILSYSQIRIGCGSGYQLRHILASIVSMLLIFSCFLYGFLHYGSLHMKGALHTMGLLFFITMAYFILYPASELRRVGKLVDEESGREPVQYKLYMRSGTILLDLAAALIPFSIFYTPALAIAGPIILICLLFYIICFIALGFDIRTVKNIITDESEKQKTARVASVHTGGSVKVQDEDTLKEEELFTMGEEDKRHVSLAIENWRHNQGYGQTELNSVVLATRLNISKRMLVQYLREVEGKTFRIWLSDLRLEEAKRMMKEHPDYSNETIAEACGFSRTYLQSKFKESTGLTINEWKESSLAG